MTLRTEDFFLIGIIALIATNTYLFELSYYLTLISGRIPELIKYVLRVTVDWSFCWALSVCYSSRHQWMKALKASWWTWQWMIEMTLPQELGEPSTLSLTEIPTTTLRSTPTQTITKACCPWLRYKLLPVIVLQNSSVIQYVVVISVCVFCHCISYFAN